ncbi:uncharacterized protein LOC131247166 [Magnolia sinica]|uniref:uncharacterized protein LOC131247166 n=1 Tax=Magnolia sinica TaxID=86752 RepID=UPI00265842AA|nr:uncharacterized protein LOC131247166 [Magnolia sinica]
MSKSNFSKTSHFPSLLLQDILSLFSFIHSHPLYFAYLIFFFPYILHLLSFLYPLLLSTSLLLLSLLTISPHLDTPPRCGFLINTCQAILNVFRTKLDGDDDTSELGLFEPLASMASELEACMGPHAVPELEALMGPHAGSENSPRSEELVERYLREDPTKIVIGLDSRENFTVPAGLDSGRFGSMRREKEWKRTLACKLYEERQTVDGIEGMDSLWEVHEVDSGKIKVKNKNEKKKGRRKGEVEEEEEDEDIDGQLCCLQALRFSTGKMNLGMGRLNSMRISKAFKGIGLFVRRERKIP